MKLTDLEITKRCAEKIGLTATYDAPLRKYDPLHDDAQAMALVKEFKLWIGGWLGGLVCVSKDGRCLSTADDLNRAICQCVAKL